MSYVPLYHPNSDIFTRPSLSRLFCAVRAVERDDTGRAVRGEAFYLDAVGSNVAWHPWEVGHVLHWHPFKVKLCRTPRAGLHVTSEWRTANDEMRYGSNFMLRSEGVFVLKPSSVLEVGESLNDAVNSPHERHVIDLNLKARFGFPHGFRVLADLWERKQRAASEARVTAA